MIKQHFSIDIHAPVQKVRYTMLSDAGYRKWTAAFNPAGSWFEGDWSQGSQMKFLGPHPEHPEQVGGMLATVAGNRLFAYISLHHTAEIQDGKIREGGEWSDAFENYTFSEKDGVTTLQIDIDMTEAYADYMAQARVKALECLKEMCEIPFHPLTVSTNVYAALETVREKRTNSADIPQRCSGDDSRHTTRADNDLCPGGRFLTRMEAKDGSAGFDWTGTYTKVEPMSLIEYVMDDGRKAIVNFVSDTSCGTVTITETFDAETMHSHEQQIAGRQHILDNFKKYVESRK